MHGKQRPCHVEIQFKIGKTLYTYKTLHIIFHCLNNANAEMGQSNTFVGKLEGPDGLRCCIVLVLAVVKDPMVLFSLFYITNTSKVKFVQESTDINLDYRFAFQLIIIFSLLLSNKGSTCIRNNKFFLTAPGCSFTTELLSAVSTTASHRQHVDRFWRKLDHIAQLYTYSLKL